MSPQQQPHRQSTDWKTIIAVGGMIGGLWAGMNREMAEVKGLVAALQTQANRIEVNSVTRDNVDAVVREQIRQMKLDAEAYNNVIERLPNTPRVQ
jgi:tripartite-type tricarboxylate transporter receptor subunit TctC